MRWKEIDGKNNKKEFRRIKNDSDAYENAMKCINMNFNGRFEKIGNW